MAVPRPREGGCGIFGSALLQPARSVCVSSERFFIIVDIAAAVAIIIVIFYYYNVTIKATLSQKTVAARALYKIMSLVTRS